MNWTKDVPKVPGDYKWKNELGEEVAMTLIVEPEDGWLCVDLVMIGRTEPLPEGGEWCRLVPADEVDALLKAADPFVRVTRLQAGLPIPASSPMAEWMPRAWPDMRDCRELVEACDRAKRVMDGREH